ncbi:peptide ABC transporter substrate-binding protein [Deinococcus piscis]|uniref:Peptide ABC transporter substrate-binding protein n=1 Tax=Deinococcus piscis TaxID=394230 RepID=A0ABQ3K751_9DEIO|nr:ABC transporter substrate-binding protein [Deinococcus piscis]GHG04908.1 peptide ABC transporter substrate-binding protein [Deinococcus piscis]
MKKSAILLTTLTLMLAACDTKTTTTQSTSGTTSTETASAASTSGTDASATTTTASGTTGSAVGGASKTGKDTMVIQTSSDVPAMDPGTSYDTSSGELLENMYETLVTYKGTSIDEFEGLLATEWEEVDGGKSYRFTLRPDVKFHSGNPFTCADAEYTFQRNLVTNGAESGNWFLAESLLGTGANANDDKNITWAQIDGAVQCDGETLVFNLPKVDPAFVSKLAYTGQAIVDSKHAKEIGEWDGTEATWKDAVGADLAQSALAKDPSGTGPYEMVSADASTMTFKAFEGYWGGAAPIKNVVRQLVPEEASRVQAFLNGDADRVEFPSREVIDTQVKGKPGVVVEEGLSNLGAYAFLMNMNLEGSTNLGSGKWGDGVPVNFFQDANMRKCFVNAFNYDQYIEQVQLGYGKKRNFMLPPEFMGYDESIAPANYDMAAAEEACKAAHGGAAWENGFTVNAAYREGSKSMQTAMEILKQNIEQLNPKFKMNLVPKQWSEIIDQKNKEVMVYGGWAPDYADPDNFIHTMYHSEGYYAPRSGINDPEIDKWIDEARSTTDVEKRKAIYKQIAQKGMDQSYFIILPVAENQNVYRENLQGKTKATENAMLAGGWLWKDLSKTQ